MGKQMEVIPTYSKNIKTGEIVQTGFMKVEKKGFLDSLLDKTRKKKG